MTGFQCEAGRFVCWGFFLNLYFSSFLNLIPFTAVLSLSPSDREGKQAPACTVKASIASPKPAGQGAMPGMYSFLSRDQMHQAQCENGLCQPRIQGLAFCNSTAVESGCKIASLLKNSSTLLEGVERVIPSAEIQGIQH